MKKAVIPAALAIFGATFAVASAGSSAPAPASRVASRSNDQEKPPEKPDKKDAPVAKGDEKKDAKGAPVEVGKPAPEFSLTDLDGKAVKLADYKGKLVVLEWFSPKCPMCVWAYGEGGPLREWPEKLKKDGIVWLAVNSEDPDNAAAKIEVNKKFLEDNKAQVTVLLDPTGATGKAYGAKTTPHMMVIDEKGVLRYRGALDNAPAGKLKDGETKVNYVQQALDELKAGKAVSKPETKSYG
jgi:peroxiredoxin